MLAAEGDCAHAQLLALALYGNASITGFPLIVVGLSDVHWDQEGHERKKFCTFKFSQFFIFVYGMEHTKYTKISTI